MILTEKINIDCNDDALLKIITKITDWTPWVITRKDKLGHINFNYNGEETTVVCILLFCLIIGICYYQSLLVLKTLNLT